MGYSLTAESSERHQMHWWLLIFLKPDTRLNRKVGGYVTKNSCILERVVFGKLIVWQLIYCWKRLFVWKFYFSLHLNSLHLDTVQFQELNGLLFNSKCWCWEFNILLWCKWSYSNHYWYHRLPSETDARKWISWIKIVDCWNVH